MLKRQIPLASPYIPCSFSALQTAMHFHDPKQPFCVPNNVHVHDDGYVSLQDMNRLFRQHVIVKKRVYFKKEERVALKQFDLESFCCPTQKALICVYGHAIYWEKGNYWSYFNNEYDPVVCVWFL